MNLKVGDPVIVYKPIWMNNTPKQGYINEIFEVDSKTVYRVYFYNVEGEWTCGCNIFTYQEETIKLNIEEARDLKLKDLGI